METPLALRGLTTVNFWAADVDAAARWYADLLGVAPYYVQPPAPAPPGYVEFRIGDHHDELGIVDARFRPPWVGDAAGGAVVYWHVDDLPATYERLLAAGASPYDEPTVRGEGFVTASVVDPFGNVLGVMYNQHYLDELGDDLQA